MYGYDAHWIAIPLTRDAEDAVRLSTYDYVARGPLEALSMLVRVDDLCERRSDMLAHARRTDWDGPRLLVVLDEAQEFIADNRCGIDIQTLVGQIAKRAHKLGVRLDPRSRFGPVTAMFSDQGARERLLAHLAHV